MWSNTTQAWQGSPSTGAAVRSPVTSRAPCVASDCRPTGTPANYVVFTSRVHRTGWRRAPIAYLGGAAVFLSDDDLPTLSADGLPSAWTDDASITFKANDTGLGAQKLNVSSPSAPGSGFGGDYSSPCSGDRAYRCPNEISKAYGLGPLPRGRPERQGRGRRRDRPSR